MDIFVNVREESQLDLVTTRATPALRLPTPDYHLPHGPAPHMTNIAPAASARESEKREIEYRANSAATAPGSNFFGLWALPGPN